MSDDQPGMYENAARGCGTLLGLVIMGAVVLLIVVALIVVTFRVLAP